MSTAIKDDALYIADILDEIGNILGFTSGMGREEFLKNTMAKRAVERSIQIIGEAAKALSEDFKGKHPEIEWRKIIAMRNFITHVYGEVDHETVWEVVRHDIPGLKRKLLEGLEMDSPSPPVSRK